MKHLSSAVAFGAVVLGAAIIATTGASAIQPPEPRSGGPTSEYSYPEYKLPDPVAATSGTTDTVSTDQVRSEIAQTGASALGGAGLTIGAMWLYRRRHQAI